VPASSVSAEATAAAMAHPLKYCEGFISLLLNV